MKNHIKIFDTTLRDGEQSPGCSMNLQEKLEIAKQLEKLKVDVIEAGFPIASPGDLEAVIAISKEIKDSAVCGLARALPKDIDAAYEGIKNAVAPRIHTFIATSPVHMQYKLRMTPEQVIENAATMVAYAKKYVSDVEFSAEDACRSEPEFLVKVIQAAIDSGATVINIPDTVGYITPTEIYNLITYIKNNTRGIEKVELSVHCHNDLGMAVANSLSAVRAGATQVECTINGIGERAGNASLEEVVMAIATRGTFLNAKTGINTQQIYKASRLLSSITGIQMPPNKAIVGSNAFAHESGIHQHGVLAERTTYEIMTPESVGIPKNLMVLGKHSGRHAFKTRLHELGYELSQEELDQAFKMFKNLADKKKVITDRDIEAIVGGHSVSVKSGYYQLDNFVINSSNTISSTALISLFAGEEKIENVARGFGPIDSAFNAINLIVGKEFKLVDYSLRSVTEGKDALGEAIVKLRNGGNIVTGRGVSTDIIEASIKAYINGVNKLLANA
ncbi:MAG: 2-isopropylmalate synthase [Eubacteriales bacterium]|jgi:2-isopropylmalate synthase